MNVINFQFWFIIFHTNFIKIILCILAPGKCPEINVDQLQLVNSKKNCKIIKHTEALTDVAYAFVPTSPEYKRISPLALNLTAQNMNMIKRLEGGIDCSHKKPNDVYFYLTYNMKQLEGFIFENGTAYPEWFDSFKTKNCKEWFELSPYTYLMGFNMQKKYFLFWACVQINSTTYDRALLLMGPEISNKRAQKMFEKMLIDTNLKQTDKNIKNDVLWSNASDYFDLYAYSYEKDMKELYSEDDAEEYSPLNYDEESDEYYAHDDNDDPYYFRECYLNKTKDEYEEITEPPSPIEVIEENANRSKSKILAVNTFKIMGCILFIIIFLITCIYISIKVF